MRAIVQRVKEASVKVDNEIIGEINQGFLVFVAVNVDDELKDIDYIKNKVMNLRIFEDEEGKMNKSIMDIEGEFLVVSQFTLYGDARKGNRPSFINSAKHEKANEYYELFVEKLKNDSNLKVETGKFAADMEISLINDGPVTIQLDSSKLY
ncbi:D-aminoacyl-tRNA deacylase [Miniphocaeibacter halophilus]|uniref:D-tyrosyl-tRNA(Tyr) deacylase n=1 Tax=Miniphocaeibacter halophilus TaxID=2931922 RepID=A0AC61MTW1_9FIRM|nr:D-aminoacyl-tRNA deacylase [Miniphocaeibacter halophilus]QQK07801.1 D-tyrosyl-tRNA(Tyr) deacylase [Miniphocaeibacter halophilus]